ncbi:T9SS type A sorting domain-containing protein [Candidatus Poribacteria bacterium]|nr:T9SS type A sorting domain-containing protein [Candidatus Poribacteria bacterium]MYG08476.1 T9SS type A sorting domain-containing protein [Candidatus Poribacteria bacterium]MYK22064.1 T9SS type A sorting domain-containing protein [Candidatus Poribacteria bacterium]
MAFTDISGWDRAVPVKESENLKYYEATIWEDTAAVHLYEFSNDYDPGHRFLDPIDERVAYREQFVREKYIDMPADVPGINKDDRSHYLKDVFVNIAQYLVERHPHAEHHLTYSGHGAPGGDMFELMLNREHANVFLRYWTQELGKPLGVIDMGGPCNKAGFGDLVNFCEYARYYIGSDMPNGGYALDNWTYEKHVESDYDMQYHNVFSTNQTLEGALRERLDVTRKSYEYSRGNMIRNSTQQASYLYSCKVFLEFYPQFLIFLMTAESGQDYASHGDLLRYMMDNHAPQSLIDQYHATIIYNVDNRDFFEWTREHNGMSLPHWDYIAGIYQRAFAQLPADVNGDGVVNIIDLTLVASNFGKTGQNAADVNGDGVVNIIDLTLVAAAFGNAAAAPEFWNLQFNGTPTRTQVEQWLNQARQVNLSDPSFQSGIFVLEQLLAPLTPQKTVLLPNYPNPFNPETWIPYWLAASADVTVTISAVDGTRVRKLALGHKPIGIYQSKSRAAYWDGRNQLGEPVASGVYFYTLTAGNFTETRKMLIQK